MNRLFIALLGALVAHAGLIMLPLVAFELERSAAGVACGAAPLDVVFFNLLASESAVDEAVASHASGPVDEKPVRDVVSQEVLSQQALRQEILIQQAPVQEVSIQESLIQNVPIQNLPRELASFIPASLPTSAPAPNSNPNPPPFPEPSPTLQIASLQKDLAVNIGGVLQESSPNNSLNPSALSAHLAMRLSPGDASEVRSRWSEQTLEYVYNPKPLYPRLARRQRQEGDVLLAVLIGEKGATEEISVASSSGYELLDDAAVKAVAQWRFVPARQGDHSQAMWVKVPIQFRLQ